MTRVLLISRCPPFPLHLGDRLIIYHLARELHTRGVRFDLLAFAETAADWSLSQQQHYSAFFNEVTLFDAKARPAPELARRALFAGARFPQQAEHAFAPEMWREIERRIAANTYDVVHLFGGVQVYEFKAALGGLPTLITPYESYALYTQRALQASGSLRERLLNTFRHVMARAYERWMFRPYDAVTVVSDVDREMLRALNPGLRVEVVANGIDLSAYRPSLTTERDPARLLFVGNYEYPPNVDAALWLAREIFPRVQANHPNARLWLVGNAPTPDMQALASDAIDITGRVDSVQPYYAQAGVFVCPLRLGAGIKNKVLEALASRCAVVATPLSVDGIAVADGEHVLLGEDADALAAQVSRAITDAELRARLGEAGRALIEAQYSWARSAGQYAALYEELAHTGKNPPAGRQ